MRPFTSLFVLFALIVGAPVSASAYRGPHGRTLWIFDLPEAIRRSNPSSSDPWKTGSPVSLAVKAKTFGVRALIIKGVGNKGGTFRHNIGTLPAVLTECKQQGVDVYVYGMCDSRYLNSQIEAFKKALTWTGVKGIVLDVERPMPRWQILRLGRELRDFRNTTSPEAAIGLSGHCKAGLHRDIPYASMGDYVDFVMPQAYSPSWKEGYAKTLDEMEQEWPWAHGRFVPIFQAYRPGISRSLPVITADDLRTAETEVARRGYPASCWFRWELMGDSHWGVLLEKTPTGVSQDKPERSHGKGFNALLLWGILLYLVHGALLAVHHGKPRTRLDYGIVAILGAVVGVPIDLGMWFVARNHASRHPDRYKLGPFPFIAALSVVMIVVGLIIRAIVTPSGIAQKPNPTQQRKEKVRQAKGEAVSKTAEAQQERQLPRKPTPGVLVPTANGPLTGWTVVLDPGHGGPDPGCSWVEDFDGTLAPVRYYEASITYPMTWELAQRLRAHGARVYLTAYSEEMEAPVESAQAEMPIPRAARYTAGAVAGHPVLGKDRGGLRARNTVSQWVWANRGADSVLFVSIHIDSLNDTWQGGHVCVPAGGQNSPLAIAVADAFLKSNYARRHGGRDQRVIIPRPELGVLGRRNPIPYKILVETGVPQDKHDSWLLRSKGARQNLEAMLVDGIVVFARQGYAR